MLITRTNQDLDTDNYEGDELAENTFIHYIYM